MTDNANNKWKKLFWFGTGIPAIISLILMYTGKFHLPVESWEFTATLCTFSLFFVFHRRTSTLKHTDHKKERTLDVYMVVSVAILGTVWCALTSPLNIPVLSQGFRLVIRCMCGLGMFTLITFMNWKLRAYWAKECACKKPVTGAKNNWMRFELLICMIDFPMGISMTAVLLGCIIIMSVLPEHSIATAFAHSIDNLSPTEMHSARLSLASTFYAGAVAFHMLLGNAVFSFIQSGRLDAVIVSRNNKKKPQQAKGSNP